MRDAISHNRTRTVDGRIEKTESVYRQLQQVATDYSTCNQRPRCCCPLRIRLRILTTGKSGHVLVLPQSKKVYFPLGGAFAPHIIVSLVQRVRISESDDISICSWLPPFSRQNLLFIQPRWQLRRTYFTIMFCFNEFAFTVQVKHKINSIKLLALF